MTGQIPEKNEETDLSGQLSQSFFNGKATLIVAKKSKTKHHLLQRASAPQTAVDSETGQWKITETDSNGREKPIPPIEVRILIQALAW